MYYLNGGKPLISATGTGLKVAEQASDRVAKYSTRHEPSPEPWADRTQPRRRHLVSDFALSDSRLYRSGAPALAQNFNPETH